MELQQAFELAIPTVTLATLMSVSVLIGLKLLERSLRSAKLCSPDFPLARKLLPGSLTLIVLLGVRSLLAALSWDHNHLVRTPLGIAIVWTVAYVVARCLWVLTLTIFQRFDISSDDNLRSRRVRTQLRFLEKVGYAAVVFMAACATLLLFDGARNFGQSLLASAGVTGIIIGFAAQKSLSNLVAGFQIAFTQPLRIEDVVVVEGEWGWVEEINLTYVVLRLWDRRRLILPITYFVEKPFQNWTRTTSQIIGTVMLEVSHHVPVAKVEAELFRLLDATPLWDKDVRVLQVVEAGARSITLRALMTARNSPICWDLRCFVRRGLVEFMRTHYPEALPVVRLEYPELATDREPAAARLRPRSTNMRRDD